MFAALDRLKLRWPPLCYAGDVDLKVRSHPVSLTSPSSSLGELIGLLMVNGRHAHIQSEAHIGYHDDDRTRHGLSNLNLTNFSELRCWLGNHRGAWQRDRAKSDPD